MTEPMTAEDMRRRANWMNRVANDPLTAITDASAQSNVVGAEIMDALASISDRLEPKELPEVTDAEPKYVLSSGTESQWWDISAHYADGSAKCLWYYTAADGKEPSLEDAVKEITDGLNAEIRQRNAVFGKDVSHE